MYVIELITTDAPYISVGYWGAASHHIVRALSSAMRFEKEEDVRLICEHIRREYDGRKYVSLMPWVYGITASGKLGRRFGTTI